MGPIFVKTIFRRSVTFHKNCLKTVKLAILTTNEIPLEWVPICRFFMGSGFQTSRRTPRQKTEWPLP